MKSTGAVHWRHVSAVGAIAVLVWLGNLRPATSEGFLETNAAEIVVAEASAVDRSVDVDGMDKGVEARLIPAIYAWDPDVRLIYLRRLSKWM